MKTNSRESYVELSRIIACFLVVCLHIRNNFFNECSSFFDTAILVIFSGSVCVFWLITGFYIFNSNWKDLLKKAFKKIWIPTILISIISTICYELFLAFVKNTKTIDVMELLLEILKGIVNFKNFAPSCSHLWFMYIYVLVILCVPVIRKIIVVLEKSKKRLYFFAFLSFIVIVINDIYCNKIFNFGSHYLNGLIPAIIVVIYGYFIHKLLINNQIRTKASLISVILFLLGISRIIIKYYGLKIGIENYIENWYSSITIIYYILIVILCYFGENTFKDKQKIIRIGKETYFIYLIHPFIIKILYRVLYPFAIKYCDSNITILLAIICLTIVVILICISISVILNRVGLLIKKEKQL